MALTGPADLATARVGDVFYWREQDMFGALFHRLTVTGVDADSVYVVDDQEDSKVFDRHTAQVRWPDGLGRSYLEHPSGQVEAVYELFRIEEELSQAARELSQRPASATGGPGELRSRAVEHLEVAIDVWKSAHCEEDS